MRHFGATLIIVANVINLFETLYSCAPHLGNNATLVASDHMRQSILRQHKKPMRSPSSSSTWPSLSGWRVLCERRN